VIRMTSEKELVKEIGQVLNDIDNSLDTAEQEMMNDAKTVESVNGHFVMIAWETAQEIFEDSDWDLGMMRKQADDLGCVEYPTQDVKNAIDYIDGLIGLVEDLRHLHTVHLYNPVIPHNTFCGLLVTNDDDKKAQEKYDEDVITCVECKSAWLKIKDMMEQ